MDQIISACSITARRAVIGRSGCLQPLLLLQIKDLQRTT